MNITTNWNRQEMIKLPHTAIIYCTFGMLCSDVVADNAASFKDITKASGIDFVHFNGMNGNLYFVEMMGSGGALVDYDQDGDLDVLLIQSNQLFDIKNSSNKNSTSKTNKLYRNDGYNKLTDSIQFSDVTIEAGLQSNHYGIGVSVGDVNNDGWPDLYLNNFGNNQLLLNHQGIFKDITQSAGVDDPRWSVSSSFTDIDNDGDLDLYVGNYVDYSISRHKICKTSVGKADYCSPKSYNPESDRLFENIGNGQFRDISIQSGISKSLGGALGVIAADFDGDGKTDIYVANDGTPNFLWINQGNNKFSDEGLLAGVAVNGNGMAEASMGVDAADFDNDNDLDLFMTHMDKETNTLFSNDGSGWFDDTTSLMNLARGSMPFTGFGTNWVDIENDGDLDIVIANGAVLQISKQLQFGEVLPLKQSNQVFVNNNGKFEDSSSTLFAGVLSKQVSRGLLSGDLDNDGDIDLIFSNNNDRPQILINTNSQNNNWLGLELLKNHGKSSAIGSRVVLTTADGTRVTRIVHRDGSYASSKDPRVIFGLGKLTKAVTIDVYWSDGSHSQFNKLKLNQYHKLIQGKGKKINEK